MFSDSVVKFFGVVIVVYVCDDVVFEYKERRRRFDG